MQKILSVVFSLLLFTAALMSGLSACSKPQEEQDVQFLYGETLIETQTPYVKWEGRYDYTPAEGAKAAKVNLYHTASGFTVEFTGTSLTVEFDSEIRGEGTEQAAHYPYYNVAVDDEVIPTVAPERTFCLTGGTQSVVIVDNLPEGKHQVQCLKMSEPYDARTSVVSMETDGSFLPRDVEFDAGNFKFMFVCASGGSGHGALGYSDDGKGSLGRTSANSSSLHAFNYLTARRFGADVQFVANSGWGLRYPASRSVYEVLDYSGITVANNVAAAKTTAKWDAQQWIPDVIIFNIGGNDTTDGSFEQRGYQETVVATVQKLHEQYPNAYMVWTHTNSKAGNYAVSALTDAEIRKQSWFTVAIIPQVGNDGTVGANSHNSMQTHITTADVLAETLQTTWKFMPIRENVRLEDYQSKLQLF